MKGRLIRAVLAGIPFACLALPSSAQQVTQYEYDALGRLTAVDVSGGLQNGTARDYALDDAGNRTAVAASTDGEVSQCEFRTADVTVSDGFPAYVHLDKISSCTTTVVVGYQIAQLSGPGTGSYAEGGLSGGNGNIGVNATRKTLTINPVAGSVPQGSELVLRVRFSTVTQGATLLLSSSIVTIRSSQ